MQKKYFFAIIFVSFAILLLLTGVFLITRIQKNSTTRQTTTSPLPRANTPSGDNSLQAMTNGQYLQPLYQSTFLLKAMLLNIKSRPEGGAIAHIQFLGKETSKNTIQSIILSPNLILTKHNVPSLFTTSDHIKQTILPLKTVEPELNRYKNASILFSFKISLGAGIQPKTQKSSIVKDPLDEMFACNKGLLTAAVSGNPVNCEPTATEIIVYENF